MKPADPARSSPSNLLPTVGMFAAASLLPAVLAAAALLFSSAGPPTSTALLALGGAALASAVVGTVLALWLRAQTERRVSDIAESLRKMTREESPASLRAEEAGEFAPFAVAFNKMARQLAAQRAAQGLLAKMDETLHTKLDLRNLVRAALRCACDTTRAEAAVLVLLETASGVSMQVFVMRRAARGRLERVRVTVEGGARRDAGYSANLETIPDAPLPAQVVESLRKDDAVEHFFALPLSRGGRDWGTLVTGHKAASRLNSGQAQVLGGVVDRLVAGLRASEQERKLHALASVDRLTRLPNRARFQAMLAELLAGAKRDRQMLVVLCMGLDRFKQVNACFGEAAGDRVLKEAAKRIGAELLASDVLARPGGDKFAIVLSHLGSRRDAARVARALIQSLSRAFEVDGKVIYTGASVGIAVYPDCETHDAQVWQLAETAMAKAKQDGGNRVAFYDPGMKAQSTRRAELDAELRLALARDELVLHYQPQLDLATGALCGVEALVRWQHPTRGLLPPGEFIETAEQIGLIPEIGAWVLREACLQHRRWRGQGVDVPRVSVNASNGQLPRSNFVATVRQIMRATEMAPGALEIEVTESMLLDGGKAALESLNQLTGDGVLIAIDDFGTGYSSFNYLKIMPARVLKLDMSFIVDINADNDAGKIVSAMISMAHALQKEVVAEGIERADQLMLLKRMGCDRGQGYLLGRPVDAAQIARTYEGTWQGERPAPLKELPPLVMASENAAPARQPGAARPAPARASEAPSAADPWGNSLLEEQMTVPRIPSFDEIIGQDLPSAGSSGA
jgi:diguanylate cyclase (GGDEF)-like protein